MWLQRFATHPAAHRALDSVRALPAPTGLRQTMFTELAPLWAHRRMLDDTIVAWVGSLGSEDLGHVLVYANTRGVRANKRFVSLLAHFFNHQTHHRGQASTLLFQAGQDIGATDLLMLIPNEPVEETPAP